MTSFDIRGVHPDWRGVIEECLAGLSARYPAVSLHRVTFSDSPHGDRSLGFEDDGTIYLKRAWFCQDPSVLKNAALRPPFFHGPMTEEPRHVLTHEFGHVASDGLPAGWRERAEAERLAATMNRDLAPSDYALADADEFFAELFAVRDMGFATPEQLVAYDRIVG